MVAKIGVAKAASDEQHDTKFAGGFTITKLVREHIALKEGGDQSFGQMLDAQLEEAAMSGQEVQSVEFEVNPDAWKTFASAVRGSEEIVYDRDGPR